MLLFIIFMLYLQIYNNSHLGNLFVKKQATLINPVFEQTMKVMPVKPERIGSTGISHPVK